MSKADKTYHLSLNELSDTYFLEGICSSLEDFELAFQLNKKLESCFYRVSKDIDFPSMDAFFSRYIWETEREGVYAELYANKYQKPITHTKNLKNTLFNAPHLKEVYLLPEFKQLDYILKVNEQSVLELLKAALQEHPAISLHYTLNQEKIVNQMNLIFD